MAGRGSRFVSAGYTFPKPLIDVAGMTMIEVVIKNLHPKKVKDFRFIFICQREHYEQYDLYNIFRNAVGGDNFEVVKLNGVTAGAACTVLTAKFFINNQDDILIANSDQYVDFLVDDFIKKGREGNKDGLIQTFEASHPKWSYVRIDKNGKVLETAEKKLISNKATTGLYYFKSGSDFVRATEAMIKKDCRYNGEFYVCPVYNELIIEGKDIFIDDITIEKMHGLGTPEDLKKFLECLNSGQIKLNS
ncbi:MAG: glycosyltransferase family 2 protein [Candidatus Paceibacterota bacterium]|jgi:NDP-sugar pyrophosphorylase family protein